MTQGKQGRRLESGTLMIRLSPLLGCGELNGPRRMKRRLTPGLKNAPVSVLFLGVGTTRHSAPVIDTTPTLSGVSGPPDTDQTIKRLSL